MIKAERQYYEKKIIDKKELPSLFAAFPREHKVVLCHGVFDVVHPGHIRHLMYAKSLGHSLVVSITADKFVNKGENRPHVPQNLRAMSLASISVVDYVLINDDSNPLELLSVLKPDIFAKGFEYSLNNLPKPTREELEVIRTFGGKMLFTPGDIVFSSTKFLNMQKPDLKFEILVQTMNRFEITEKIVFETLENLKKPKVLVLGDTIVDEIVEVDAIGGPTKTPNLSVRKIGSTYFLGGAGIVAAHLSNIGAEVEFCTMFAQDSAGLFAKKELDDQKIKLNLIKENSKPTTIKSVISCLGQRLLKIDTVDNRPLDLVQVERISDVVEKFDGDIIIFSDFRHGIFNANTIEIFKSKVRSGIMKVADSQLASRWGNILDFKGMDLITPNEREARFSLGDQDSSLGSLIGKLTEQSQAKNIIMKLGAKGVMGGCSSLKTNALDVFNLESFVSQLKDPVGAGDALLAYSAITYFSTKSLPLSALIGSVAAACACEQEGNKPISKSLVLNKFKEIFKNASYETLE